jgi:hypothetical protein
VGSRSGRDEFFVSDAASATRAAASLLDAALECLEHLFLASCYQHSPAPADAEAESSAGGAGGSLPRPQRDQASEAGAGLSPAPVPSARRVAFPGRAAVLAALGTLRGLLRRRDRQVDEFKHSQRQGHQQQQQQQQASGSADGHGSSSRDDREDADSCRLFEHGRARFAALLSRIDTQGDRHAAVPSAPCADAFVMTSGHGIAELYMPPGGGAGAGAGAGAAGFGAGQGLAVAQAPLQDSWLWL